MKLIQLYSRKNIKCNFEKPIVRSTSLTLLLQIIYSSNLWLSVREFPLIPVFESLKEFHFLEYILLFPLIVSLLVNIFLPNKNGSALIFFSLLCLVLLDINRLQPWTYIYLIIYALSFLETGLNKNTTIRGGMQILIIGLFFWSGISKLNYNFLDLSFITILTKSFKIQDLSFFINYKEIGFFIPVIEILASLFLLFNRSRKLGIGLVVSCHLFIIFFVSPFSLGKDFIVIPWNILMIYLTLLVFKNSKNIEGFEWHGKKEKVIKIVVIILVLILPSLNQIGKWDHFMSFSLYSDKTDNLLIVVEDAYVHKLSPSLQKRFVKSKEIDGGQILNLLDWSFKELKTPYYPEDWVLDEISKTICKYGIPAESLVFLKIRGAINSFSATTITDLAT